MLLDQRGDLVLDEGDERGDYEGNPAGDDGWELVAQTVGGGREGRKGEVMVGCADIAFPPPSGFLTFSRPL